MRAVCNLSRQSGLTLFETLLATAVLGIVFLGLVAALGGSFLAAEAAYASTRSQNLARRVMEEVVETDFEDLLALDGNVVEEDGFTAEISAVEVTPDLRLIEVLVRKPGTHTATTRLLTYRARR